MTNTWMSAVGAWGDTIVAYGRMCKLLKERGEEKTNVVFFGLDQNICEFLKAQPKIDKVEWLKCEPPQVAGKYIRLAHTDPLEWYKITGLDAMVPGLCFTHLHDSEPYRNFDVSLPPSLADWETFLNCHEPYILFQSYSTQSCDYDGHWPHWTEALRYLSETMKVVVVGEMPPEIGKVYDTDLFERPNVVCLVGQTHSMSDVFHIANRSVGVVTTCNALAYYALLKCIPAVVVCNNIIKPATPHYYDWLKHGTNTVLDHDASMDEFTRSVCCLRKTE